MFGGLEWSQLCAKSLDASGDSVLDRQSSQIILFDWIPVVSMVFLSRERKINVYLWVIPVTDEQLGAGYRSKHLPLMSLQAWFRSDAKGFSGGTTGSMRHMQSHNSKLH